MPQFKIHHVTKYTYQSPVHDSANQVMLFPVKDNFQEVVKQELTITGEPVVETYKDYYGNEVGSFMYAEPHNSMVIDSMVEVVTRPREMPVETNSREEQWDYLKDIKTDFTFIDFMRQERFAAVEEIKKVTQLVDSRSVTPFTAAQRLNEYVFKNFSYIKGITNVETTPDEIWQLKAGVCQDFAHVLLVMLRIIGIPARYVSGYICPNQNGMRGEGATHAWVEAYIPFYGWLGLDPTNNCLVKDLHVRLAVGRNFSDCSPVRGTYKGASDHSLDVGVSVSYENGQTQESFATVLKPHPVKPRAEENQNSYRQYMQMIQQQQ